MLQRVLSIFSFCILMGCSSLQSSVVEPTEKFSIHPDKAGWSKVYRYSFESVWRAAQLTLKYPVAVNNVDNGVLESDWIRAEEGFQAPAAGLPPGGTRYKFNIVILKGRSGSGGTVKVSVLKQIEKRHDFFSDSEERASDGIEEKLFLYRVERELVIDDAIKRAAAAPSKANSP